MLSSCQVPFYQFVESLIRISFQRMREMGNGTNIPASVRFETFMAQHIEAFALKKQRDTNYLDFLSKDILATLTDTNR